MPRLVRFKYVDWARAACLAFGEDEPAVVAVDTETTGVGWFDTAFGATVTWRRPEGDLSSWYFELADEDTAEYLQVILDRAQTWVMHNAKFDLQKLAHLGIRPRGQMIHDTQSIYFLLDENSPKGLKKLAVSVLRWKDTITVAIKSGPRKGQTREVPAEEHRLAAVRRKLGLRKEDGYHLLPREVLIPYALRDTEFTLRLYETLAPRLAKLGDGWGDTPAEREPGGYYTHVSLPLKHVLLRMEAEGVGVDVEYLRATASEYGVRVMQAWSRVTELAGNPELNPNAPAQLQTAFAARGLNLESTDEATLKGVDDDLAQAVLQYRSDKKIHQTYLVALLAEQRKGVAHPAFREEGARSGRMSSGAG